MLKLILLGLTIALVLPGATLGFQGRKKPQQRRVTGGESGWAPDKESLLYKYTRSLGDVDRVEINEVRFGRTDDSRNFWLDRPSVSIATI